MNENTAEFEKNLTVVGKAVQEFGDVKAALEMVREELAKVKINGPDDKDGYERVRAAIAVLRPKRTGLEAERKSVVKPYNDTVKLINGEYEKITTLIQEGPEVLPPLKFITFCIFQF